MNYSLKVSINFFCNTMYVLKCMFSLNCLSLKIDSESWQTFIHWFSINRLRDLFLIMVIVKRVTSFL